MSIGNGGIFLDFMIVFCTISASFFAKDIYLYGEIAFNGVDFNSNRTVLLF